MPSLMREGFKKVWGSKGTIGSYMLNGYFISDSYNTSRDEGNGMAYSGLKAVAENAPMMMMGVVPFFAASAAFELPSLAVSAVDTIQQQGRSLARQNSPAPFKNAVFQDSQQFSTMRQAGMALAQKSKYNLQQAMLGNEAQSMHR